MPWSNNFALDYITSEHEMRAGMKINKRIHSSNWKTKQMLRTLFGFLRNNLNDLFTTRNIFRINFKQENIISDLFITGNIF